MKLFNSPNQQVRHPLFDASGTITTGGAAQLLLAQSAARSYLLIENLSAGPLWLEFGCARATATLSSGAVASCAITNVGFGFTKAPVVQFLGGGNAGNSSYLGLNQPNGDAPQLPALGHAVLVANAVSSIVIDQPGTGYVKAPYVFMFNNDLDPYGVAVPATNSGLLLQANGGSFVMESTTCTTDAVAIFGATTGQQFACKWMD